MYLSLYGSYQIHIIIAIDLEVYCYRGQGHLHNYNTSFINRDWYYRIENSLLKVYHEGGTGEASMHFMIRNLRE